MAAKKTSPLLMAVLAVWLVAGMVPLAYGQVSFAPAVNYAVAGFPIDIAVGDLNRDGKLDLVTANWGNKNVSVLLGNGDGTFGAASYFFVVDPPPTPGANPGPRGVPQGVAVADLNGDGTLDLVTANSGTNNVSVLLGNGGGTFGKATQFPAGTEPNSVSVGDFNNDGKRDLVTADSGSSSVSVLLGNGDGTFGAAANFSAGPNTFALAVADFNVDGNLDVAVSKYGSNKVSVLLGNGDGTFGGATDYTVSEAEHGVAAGDFNGDGKLDLVTSHGNSFVSVLLGTGTGSFGAASFFSAGGDRRLVVVGDLNGDGRLDLAMSNTANNDLRVLLGNGDGTFGAAAIFPIQGNPHGVALGDFNGDGKLDVVTGSSNGTVNVLLNTTGPVPDTIAPVIRCANPDGQWHGSDVSIACTAQDSGSGLANPADASFYLSTNVSSGTETSNAATGTQTVCDKKNNCATVGPISGNKVDKKKPSVSCGTADDQWHSSNLSVGCIASDGGSGLVSLGDANFLLQTNVAPGAESANATAAPQNVCDAVSNCTSAAVPGGIKVDRKAPSITITTPQATRYLPRQGVMANYSCADGGSGVALCVGPVPSGSNIDTAPPAGPKTFTVFAADKTGNVTSQTVTYQIGTPGP